MAFVYTRDPVDNIKNVDSLKRDLAFVKQFYDNNNFRCSYWATGVEEASSDPGLRIFPNPASDELNIRLSEGTMQEVAIYDALGQLVDRRAERTSNLKISVGSFSPGLHLVVVKVDGKYLTERVLIGQ